MQLLKSKIEKELSKYSKPDQIEKIFEYLSQNKIHKNDQLYFLNKALAASKALKNKTYIAETRFKIAMTYFNDGQIKKAKSKLMEVAEFSKKNGINKTYANCFKEIGYAYYLDNNFTDSEKYQRLLLKITLDDDDLIEERMWAYKFIGQCLLSRGLPKQGAEYFLAGMKLAESFPEYKKCNAFASLYTCMLLSNKSDSINYLKKAIEIYEANESYEGLSRVNTILAQNYYQTAEKVKAIDKAYLAFEYGKRSQITNMILESSFSYISMVLYFVETERESGAINKSDFNKYIEKVEKTIDEIIPIANKSQFDFHKQKLKFNQAYLHILMGKYISSIELLEDLYSEIKGKLKNYFALNTLQLLVDSHKKAKRFEKGLYYSQQLFVLLKEYQEANDIKVSSEITRKYESKLKEEKIIQLQELKELKSKFFSQVTHELRTPLTLITGPTQQILNSKKLGSAKEQAALIERNANRLLNLVNQMLDVNKLESKKLEVKTKAVSIKMFMDAIAASFKSLALEKKIKFNYKFNFKEKYIYLDEDKVEKIIFNLLSNAFKFTKAGNEVSLVISQRNSRNKSINNLIIEVSDTGIGIAKNDLKNIFDRFYQADDSYTRSAEGTGIGLSLVKEFTELMEGKVEVKSDLNKGSKFSVTLPVKIAKAIKNIGLAKSVKKTKGLKQKQKPKSKTKLKDAPILLVIEDNIDMQSYIETVFENEYQIIKAFDGEEGIKKAEKNVPDVIISDVMMPKKNGYEVCDSLKQNQKTSHIPIVMLTAKATQKSRIEGFEKGADAYLAKPFSALELQLQCKNLLQTNKSNQSKYFQIVEKGPSKKVAVNKETQFLENLIAIIQSNIDDENLDVEILSKKINLSDSQLYRKLKALTGYSVSEFVRTTRLSKGKSMLENKEGNISEIAYKVGMSPNYFSRAFNSKYGIRPKALLVS